MYISQSSWRQNPKTILDSSSSHLEVTLQWIGKRGALKWPRAQEGAEKSDKAQFTIKKDYEILLTALKESRKAIQQGKKTKAKFLLAFVYSPMSIITSFFGMKFQEFGQGHLGLWIGAAAMVAAFTIQSILYTFWHNAVPI
ncbi:hypothetical protein GLAREA_01825 [Glarea lozoyensis ATCC 20868]|uniref:Uncharacterized protein n=1 Tax=Glarea lozoyensis (strain ATCC 20868 / MF5171) TaxID=1116229 RepID=S3DH62_GLAL2|nr:uncharacterized protein GLAREA_01825 [Glarea lozoyensis ATCC 20868]EPE25913.1 hypothetical protein GLAREA_01825 [Glarea lozoyensis ATCC 20868]